MVVVAFRLYFNHKQHKKNNYVDLLQLLFLSYSSITFSIFPLPSLLSSQQPHLSSYSLPFPSLFFLQSPLSSYPFFLQRLLFPSLPHATHASPSPIYTLYPVLYFYCNHSLTPLFFLSLFFSSLLFPSLLFSSLLFSSLLFSSLLFPSLLFSPALSSSLTSSSVLPTLLFSSLLSSPILFYIFISSLLFYPLLFYLLLLPPLSSLLFSPILFSSIRCHPVILFQSFLFLSLHHCPVHSSLPASNLLSPRLFPHPLPLFSTLRLLSFLYLNFPSCPLSSLLRLSPSDICLGHEREGTSGGWTRWEWRNERRDGETDSQVIRDAETGRQVCGQKGKLT